jgi:hypothetical protein
MKDRFTPKKKLLPKTLRILSQKTTPQNTTLTEGDDDEKHRVSLNLPKEKYDIVKKKSFVPPFFGSEAAVFTLKILQKVDHQKLIRWKTFQIKGRKDFMKQA